MPLWRPVQQNTGEKCGLAGNIDYEFVLTVTVYRVPGAYLHLANISRDHHPG